MWFMHEAELARLTRAIQLCRRVAAVRIPIPSWVGYCTEKRCKGGEREYPTVRSAIGYDKGCIHGKGRLTETPLNCYAMVHRLIRNANP